MPKLEKSLCATTRGSPHASTKSQCSQKKQRQPNKTQKAREEAGGVSGVQALPSITEQPCLRSQSPSLLPPTFSPSLTVSDHIFPKLELHFPQPSSLPWMHGQHKQPAGRNVPGWPWWRGRSDFNLQECWRMRGRWWS